MRHEVEALIPSVRNQKDIFQFRAVHHCAKRTALVGLPLSEQGGVHICTLKQIIHCIQMEHAVRALPIRAREERIRVIGIGGNLNVRPIGGN